jgi:hypothetical protein
MVFDPSVGWEPSGYPDPAPAPVPAAPAPAAPAPAPAGTTPAADQYWREQTRKGFEQLDARRAQAPVQQQQQQTEQTEQVEPVELLPAHDLKLPEWVSMKEQTPERLEAVQGFSALAPQVGIDAPTAQNMLDLAVDAATVLDYSVVENADADDAKMQMESLFGTENAKNLIQRAQLYAQARGEAFKDWLDQGAGNDPSVLLALAFAQANYFNHTPASAQAAITKLMATPEYGRGDRLTLLKLNVLNRIAHNGGPSAAVEAPPTRPEPAQQTPRQVESEADLRAQMAALFDKHGNLTPESRAKYMELLGGLR